jgi:hypothetical protein
MTPPRVSPVSERWTEWAVRIIALSIVVAVTGACSEPICPCDELITLNIAGIMNLDGQPIVADIALWDSQLH